MSKTIRFFDHDAIHLAGDENCHQDWCGQQGYPRHCKCGGLIHAAYGDFNPGGPSLRECDRCGKSCEEQDT